MNTCFCLQFLVTLVRTYMERCLDLTQISPFAVDLMHWEGISLRGDRRKISSKYCSLRTVADTCAFVLYFINSSFFALKV